MKLQHIFIRLAITLGLAVLAIGLSMKSFILDVYAQSDKKIIRLADTIKPQLKFTEVKVGQKEQIFGESFTASPDWIKDLSFKLENTSGKKIVFINVYLNFPETKSTGNMLTYQIGFGQRPGLPPRGNNPPMLLNPGETVEASLVKEKDKIYKFVNERQPIETIHEVEIQVALVIFDDKTAWFVGSFMRQDPNDPRRYNPIEDKPQQ